MDLQIQEQPGLLLGAEEGRLSARLLAEFREMPALRITAAQAARLSSLSARQCERVLAALVDAGALRTDGRLFTITNARP
ncbi:MAG: hypothetical protein ACM3NQ_10840 [Bacteroidales bacterium]